MQRGEVKFIGETQFATGEWIGIELDEAEGKNDGTVNGIRYFGCQQSHGLFLKRIQCRLDRSAPTAAITQEEEELSGFTGEDESNIHMENINNFTPSPKRQRENQLEKDRYPELRRCVESLLLDKEQLSIELELAEEKLRMLSLERESWPARNVSKSDGDKCCRSKADTEKTNESQPAKLEEFKASEIKYQGASEEIFENQESQSTMCLNYSNHCCDLESTIEHLTIKNTEMASKIKALESAITDLEAAQEISDEIERSQHKEIEELNSKYGESLNLLNFYEREINTLKSESNPT